jgi:transcriptional regulator
MYLPSHFQETRPEALQQLMQRHPLATLILQTPGELAADHVPLLLRGDAPPQGRLVGHVARANPLWRKAGAEGIDCLVIFQGPQGYISPNGYATKQEHGKVVPTWNYDVVHVQGRLRAVDDALWLRGLLDELTATHEADQPRPWAPADAPADYLARILQAVVGIEIEILGLTGKAKLSQNQPAVNQQSLIQALQARGDAASSSMAQAIQARVVGEI